MPHPRAQYFTDLEARGKSLDHGVSRSNSGSNPGKVDSRTPLSVETASMIYMETAEWSPAMRSVGWVGALLGARFRRTDSGRACSWMAAFSDFRRESEENYKDVWARFARYVEKLDALWVETGDHVVFNRPNQAIRLLETQLHRIVGVGNQAGPINHRCDE